MITITIDLPDDIVFELMKLAHERNITFNQLVNEILRDFLDAENQSGNPI